MKRRKECEFFACERRRDKHEMIKIKYFTSRYIERGCWVTRWICREHFPTHKVA